MGTYLEVSSHAELGDMGGEQRCPKFLESKLLLLYTSITGFV